MKLEKAIEILSDSANRGITTFNQDYKDAQRLGIEALKRVQAYKKAHASLHYEPMPGETED